MLWPSRTPAEHKNTDKSYYYCWYDKQKECDSNKPMDSSHPLLKDHRQPLEWAPRYINEYP